MGFQFLHRQLSLCSNILSSPAYDLYTSISQLIRYARTCPTKDYFLFEAVLLTNRLMLYVRLCPFGILLFRSSTHAFSSIHTRQCVRLESFISFENLHCSVHTLAFLHRTHIVFLSPTVTCIWQCVKMYPSYF
jgi:hypothetical protein